MAEDLGSIHCLYSAKAVPMNGAPSFECCSVSILKAAGKCAGPIPAKNRANAQKIHPDPK